MGASVLPDPVLTPGKTDVALTQEVICAPEFRTEKYRHVTEAQKKRVTKAYGLDYSVVRSLVEIDHLVSLELGGNNDDGNLWPQFYLPVPGARQKDLVENFLHAQVCEGHVSLQEAQHEISTDWLKVYKENFK